MDPFFIIFPFFPSLFPTTPEIQIEGPSIWLQRKSRNQKWKEKNNRYPWFILPESKFPEHESPISQSDGRIPISAKEHVLIIIIHFPAFSYKPNINPQTFRTKTLIINRKKQKKGK